MKFISLSTLTSIATYALLIPSALANVEKTIFIAPGIEQVPQYTARRAAWHLGDLRKLTHTNHTRTVDIETGFPTASRPSGPETWFLLDELKPGKRYEARICWPASEPASFDVQAFNMSEIMAGREDLYSSLASAFSTRLTARPDPGEPLGMYDIVDGSSSRMLLRIQAKADYFTHDKTRMQSVQPVPVHIILDPFHFNLLPHSLLLTVILVIITVIVAVVPVVYAVGALGLNVWGSKGGLIMNAITLGEADRDGDSDSDGEIGLFAWRGRGRSVSRGRRRARNPWGSAVAAEPASTHGAQEVQRAVPQDSSEEGADEAGNQAQGRGGSRGRGKSNGKGKKGRRRRRT